MGCLWSGPTASWNCAWSRWGSGTFNAEVVSGLEVGEVVSTGAVETTDASGDVPEFTPPTGMGFIK
jgi:hypothetical protein